MRKWIQWVLAGLLPVMASSYATAQAATYGAVNGFCNAGAVVAKVQGISSTNYLQGISPLCKVSVYFTGTTTLAPIYSTGTGTVLGNPFTANTNGSWLFFATGNTGYDVIFNGGVPALSSPPPLIDVVPSMVTTSGSTTDYITSYAQFAQDEGKGAFDQNSQTFSDGSPYYSAGPFYAQYGEYIDDQTLACLGNLTQCSTTLLLNTINKFIGYANGAGEFPINIAQQLTPTPTINFYSAWDNHHAYATGDGRIMVPQNLYLYCLKVGIGSAACTAEYTATVAAIKTAWAATPRNSSTGLYTVVPGNEYICGQAFMEYMRNTGDVANCNVWAAIDDADMKALATAAGDSTNANYFASDLATLVSGIRSILINPSTGLLITATIQNASNDDIPSSSLAAFCDTSPVMAPCGILTAAQKLTMANYFAAGYSSIVNQDGYILETPKPGGWTTIGYIPTGGGPPYTASGFTSTQYQGGFWSFQFDWFYQTLLMSNATKAASLVQSFLNGADPSTEYYNQGSIAPDGTSPNLESPQGAVAATVSYPTNWQFPTPLPSGINVGHNNAGGPVILDGGTSNNIVLELTSSSAANTAFYLANTGIAGHTWADFTAGYTAPQIEGSRCWLDVTVQIIPLCLFGSSATSADVLMDSGSILQWAPGHLTGTVGAADVNFRRLGAGNLELGNAATANAGILTLGNVQLNTMQPPGVYPSQGAADYATGTTRLIGYGANTTTQGIAELQSVSSDASVSTTFVLTGAAATSSVPVVAPQVKVGGGALTVYRCTTAGTLPIGALTTTSSNCGASVATSLVVN